MSYYYYYYYYLAAFTAFPHLPAPIWQLYYLLPPLASIRLWANVGKCCTVQPNRPQMTTWRTHIACGTPTSTHTHSEYVILIAFLREQWLHKSASMLRYTYIACIVKCIFLNLILLTWRIWWAFNNASRWQMGFNWAFKGLNAGTSVQLRRGRQHVRNYRSVQCTEGKGKGKVHP